MYYIISDCVCPPEFTGPHCEFLQLLYDTNQTKSNPMLGTDKIHAASVTNFPFMFNIALISGVTIFAAYMFVMIKRKAKSLSLARQGMEGVEFDTKFVNGCGGDENETIKDGDSLDDGEEWRDIVL